MAEDSTRNESVIYMQKNRRQEKMEHFPVDTKTNPKHGAD